jgi:hypothetical protein
MQTFSPQAPLFWLAVHTMRELATQIVAFSSQGIQMFGVKQYSGSIAFSAERAVEMQEGTKEEQHSFEESPSS